MTEVEKLFFFKSIRMNEIIKNYRLIGFVIGFFFIGCKVYAAQPVYETTFDWLSDQPTANMVTRVQTNKLSKLEAYPRRSTGNLMNKLISSAQLACFDIVGTKPLINSTIIAAHTLNPNLSFLRVYSPQAYQGWTEKPGNQATSYPFVTSGPATANNQIFAGHWAYKPYTALSAEIGSGAGIQITVSDPSKIESGTYYYVIRPIDSWESAEQVKITKSGSTITIDSRAYKSFAKTWPSGSLIARHQTGNGPEIELWVYNLSTRCPIDANGKKGHEAFSAWLANNYEKDATGVSISACDSILYDADFYNFVDGGRSNTRNSDFDNDGVADWGIDDNGVNHWGDGLELFYKEVRKGMDSRGRTNAVILGGSADAFGLSQNNGSQLEGAWSNNMIEDGAIWSKYDRIGYYISGLKVQIYQSTISPRISEIENKGSSMLYQGDDVETSNTPARFAFAMTMMFDGLTFANQNGFGDAFHYFDEDAVYLSPEDKFGESVLKSNTTDIRKNNKWLGKANGPYKRNITQTDFDKSKNLFPNGDFESGTISWTGYKTSISKVIDEKYEGNASLKITPTKPNTNLSMVGATATSGAVTLNSNQEYTLCIAINSSVTNKIIRLNMGTMNVRLLLTKGWSKHVLCWKQTSSSSSSLKFFVGSQLDIIWVDQLMLFKECADVFSREFENGMVIANGSTSSKTFTMNGNYQRINGNLDKTFNTGEKNISQLTLNAYEAYS